jgi:excisionase family DNA binding protein
VKGLTYYTPPVAAHTGGEPELLTIQEAADALGVSRAAIHQMLGDGRLSGPSFPGRAAAGIGRVTADSLQLALGSRASDRSRRRRKEAKVTVLQQQVRALKADVARLTGEVAAISARSSAQTDRLLRMKIAADEARAAARQARGSNRELLRQLAVALKSADAAYVQADTTDDVAQGYSDALTSFLVPDSAADLRPGK